MVHIKQSFWKKTTKIPCYLLVTTRTNPVMRHIPLISIPTRPRTHRPSFKPGSLIPIPFLTSSGPPLPLLRHFHLSSGTWVSQSVSSVAQSCPTLCDPMDCSTTGLPVHHQLLEFTQTHVYWVGDAIQPSHPLSSPFPPAFNLYQYQGLFQWVSYLHQVVKVLEFQLQHQCFQRIFRTDLL